MLDTPLGAQRWQSFRNDSGEEIPGNGLLRLTGQVTLAGQSVFTVSKPGSTWERLYAVNGHHPVAAGAYGACLLLDGPCFVHYDVADGTPALGSSWGAKAQSWKLAKNRPGFTIVGGAIHERILAVQGEVNHLVGKTSAAHNKNASGTVRVWVGAAGSEVDSGVDVGAWNLFANVASSKWVSLRWVDGNWYLVSAEC